MDRAAEELMGFDRSLGAVAAALCGDAIGGTFDLIGRLPIDEEIEHALSMPGGGPFRLAPGQVTDHGEMTLALLDALGAEACDLDAIPPHVRAAQAYVNWSQSKPFFMCTPTANALLGHRTADPKDLATSVLRASKRLNAESTSNSFLTRASPLGVWASRHSFAQAIIAARCDAELTHPISIGQHACAAYVVAIRHLILAPGDSDGAIRAARAALEMDEAAQVRDWLDAAIRGELPAGYPRPGYVGIAFTHAFAHLHRQSTPLEAMRQTLAIGGDPGSNASIVLGLIGALRGASELPQQWMAALHGVDLGKGRMRPDWCMATDLEGRVARMIGVRLDG